MSVKRLYAAAKKLPFDERVELAHRLWDEIMDGFQGWKAPSIPDGEFPWKSLKAEIDAKLSSKDRFELAQQVWSNVVEDGYEPELTPEQIAELDRRAEELRQHPERGIPWETVKAELHERLKSRKA